MESEDEMTITLSTILWIFCFICWLWVGIRNLREEYVPRFAFGGTWVTLMVAMLVIIMEKVI